MAVPCHESLAVLDVGLWSMFSTACMVKIVLRNDGGHISPSFSNWSMTLLPRYVDNVVRRSYEIHSPSE